MSQRAIWITVGLSVTAALVLLGATGTSVSFAGFSMSATGIVGGLGAGYLCRRERDNWLKRTVLAFETMSALAMISLSGAVASYCLARETAGYADPLLDHADRLLGFDWQALYRLTYSNSAVQWLSETAYGTLSWSPAVLIGALMLNGQVRFARRFVATFAATLWMTIAIFPLFPARSAWLYHLGAASPHRPMTQFFHVQAFEQLRMPGSYTVMLDKMVGLITFPSFHASCAILFIWAGWRVRWLRYPMLVTNLAMLAATPVQGTHYLVDLIGGTVCALFGITVVGGLIRHAQPQQALYTAA